MTIETQLISGPILPDHTLPYLQKISTFPHIGAYVTFNGQIRADEISGSEVIGIDYSHHPDITTIEMQRLSKELAQKLNIELIFVLHSIGHVAVGACSLWILIASKHRMPINEGLSIVVNELKEKLPIWGKEILKNQQSAWKQNT